MERPPVDTRAHYTLDYASGSYAQIASSMVDFTDLSASVAGTGELIRLPAPFWGTEEMEVYFGDARRMLRPPDVLRFPSQGNGYGAMLAAVDAAIREGRHEHPAHGRTTTAEVIGILEAIHAAIGPGRSGLPSASRDGWLLQLWDRWLDLT